MMRVRAEQPHDRHGRDGFAGAGFADQRQRASALQRERDMLDRGHLAVARTEDDGEIADFEKWRG